jgi:mRNA interferase YafQ
MYTPVYTKQFEKDVKLCKRRNKDFEKFKIIVRDLIVRKSLDPIHHDHHLLGSYVGRRECHIESDWLLIYKIDELQIIFERMGTHTDLFKE